MKFVDTINIDNNEMINVVIHRVADSTEREALVPVEGQIVFQQSNNTLYVFNGASWNALSSDSNLIPEYPTFYPEDYGAKGDGVTDDTAAIQACIDDALVAAASSGTVRIKLQPAAYLVNYPPRMDRAGYSILSLSKDDLPIPDWLPPSFNYPNIIIEGTGGLPFGHLTCRSRFKTTRNETYSEEAGQPSVLGSSTRENSGSYAGQVYVGFVKIKNVGFDMPDACRLTAIDALHFAGIETDNVEIYATGGEWGPTVVNTNTASCGIRLPTLWGTWSQRIKDTSITGPYCGIAVSKMDHNYFDRVYIGYTSVGLGFDDDLYSAGHLGQGGYITCSGVKNIISGWNQADGAVSLTGSFPTKSPQLNNLAISFEQSNAPFDHVYTVLDQNNLIYGRVILNRDALGLNFYDAGPVLGGKNLDFAITGHGHMATRRTAAPPDNQVMDSQISMYLDDTATSPKLKAKAKDSEGTVWSPTFATTEGNVKVESHTFTAHDTGFNYGFAHKSALSDSNPIFATAGGALLWGAGGSSSTDVMLSRTAADELTLASGDKLKTDDPTSAQHVATKAYVDKSKGTWFSVPNIATGTSSAPTADRVYYCGVIVSANATITGLTWFQISVGTGVNARVALYNSAGTRVANRTTNYALSAFTYPQVAFDTPYDAAAGLYYVGFVFSAAQGTFQQVAPTSASGYVAGPGSGATAASITPPTVMGGSIVPGFSTY